MISLDKIVLNYIKNYHHEYMMIDEHKKYSKEQIVNKILHYQEELNKIWKNSKNRGIAILLERDVDYICLIFATWISNGFYLPLSHDTPKKNIKSQLEAAKINFIAEKRNKKIKLRCLNNKKKNKLIEKNYKNISYIIFTSGSTGNKKGVCISNTGFVSYLDSIKKKFKSKKEPNSLVISGELTFDITIADLAFALVFGSQIIITNKSQNLISLLSMIEENKAESIYLVPSAIDKLLEFSKKIKINNLNSIKQINLGGEMFSVNLLSKIKKFFRGAKIYNFYGPTEFTVNVFCHEINLKKKYKEIPIGKPLAGISTLIKNGELYLHGKQKMLGYVNNDDQSEKINNKVYYPTGDMVEKKKNNEFFFRGRIKDYIKLDGYRINLTSIENILHKHLLVPVKISTYNNKILLFVEEKNNNKKKLDLKIQKVFYSYLEKYERPSYVIYKNKFPILESGKVDLKKLIFLSKIKK
tara:strand:+ start:147 stop:1553 length:1407 start_codon:yes stop_codon:yes gene_type:complete